MCDKTNNLTYSKMKIKLHLMKYFNLNMEIFITVLLVQTFLDFGFFILENFLIFNFYSLYQNNKIIK